MTAKMKFTFIYFVFLMTLFTSCKFDKTGREKTETNTQQDFKSKNDTYIPDTIKMYEGMPSEILKGATLKENITRIELYNFSDNLTKDTFKIEIPKGKLEYSNSKVSIINSTGKTLYLIVFPTYFLMDGYELIPNTPNNLESLEERLFYEEFEKKLTKEFYEKYYLNKINEFLKDVVFKAKKNEYFFEPDYTINKKVRNEILKYNKILCVSFPIHVGEEGTSYIGFSKIKNQAYIFAETD